MASVIFLNKCNKHTYVVECFYVWVRCRAEVTMRGSVSRAPELSASRAQRGLY